jgi:sulfate adenylyltransferase subunit 1
MTAGSVDDGKSTLIGRLLVDARGAFEDQVSAAQRDNERRGGHGIDFALLTDGLKAEREQGITIDVAYRYFATERRKFIIGDAPGHEQYTRNMVTAASTADLALILVDARYGLVTQSRRHAFIAHLLGIRHFVIAVNKMDLVGYNRSEFERIQKDFEDYFSLLGGSVDLRFVPISALQGDMVVERGEQMQWYEGETVLEILETIEVGQNDGDNFRFPVQLVSRPPQADMVDFRGYMGTIASGRIRVGDSVMVLPSGQETEVTGILTFDGNRDSAFAPQSVTLTLANDLDISRGDLITGMDNPPTARREFQATICWMSTQALRIGAKYRIRHTTRTVKAVISEIQYRIDPNTLQQEAGLLELRQNDIARVSITTLHPLVCDSYRANRETGAFILINEANDTAAAGFLEKLDRAASYSI